MNYTKTRCILLSILSTSAVVLYLAYSETLEEYSILTLVLFVALSYFYGHVRLVLNVNTLVFSILFSLILVIGQSLYHIDSSSLTPVSLSFSSILVFFGFTVLFLFILSALNNLCVQKAINKYCHVYLGKKFFLAIFIVLCLESLLCLLVYYPGISSYDIVAQTSYVYYGVSKFHPPLHTYIWKYALRISIYLLNSLPNDFPITFKPTVVYAFFQVPLVALFFAYTLYYLYCHSSRNVFVVSSLFVILNPLFSIFSIIPTKDVPFSVFFGFSALFLYKSFSEKPNYVFLFFALLLSCLFRNNFIYALLLFFILYFVCYLLNKQVGLKILTTIALAIVTFALIDKCVWPVLGVTNGSSREALSVPIQQISFSVKRNYDEMDTTTIEEIDQYIPVEVIRDNYNVRFADPVKYYCNEDYFNDHKLGFYKVWFELFKQYPSDFIIAFLELNLPYWYFDSSPIYQFSNRMYIETYTVEDDSLFARDSKIPSLLPLYESVADYSAFAKKPFLNILFSLSTPFLFILISLYIVIETKEYHKLVVLLFIFFYWSTLLLGPVSNLRYILPFIFLYPLMYHFIVFRQPKLLE